MAKIQNKTRMLYMVIDLKNDEEPLFVGNIHEVAKFSGAKESTIRSIISHCKQTGYRARYVCLGKEEDIDEME